MSKAVNLMTSLVLLWLGITCLQVGSRTHYSSANSVPVRSLSASEQIIEVDLSDKTLCYQQQCYPVAVGLPEYPTPIGMFRVRRISTHRTPTRHLFDTDTALHFATQYNHYYKSLAAYVIHDNPQDMAFTAGCVAINYPTLQYLLTVVPDGTQMVIQP